MSVGAVPLLGASAGAASGSGVASVTQAALAVTTAGTQQAFAASATRRKWIIQNRSAVEVYWDDSSPVNTTDANVVPPGGAWVERDYTGDVFVAAASGTSDCRRISYP